LTPLGIFAKDLDSFLTAACGYPAHQYNDIARGESSILGLSARPFSPIDQIRTQRLELGASQLHIEMFRPLLIRRDKWQVNVCLHRRRKFTLRFFRRLFEPLQRHPVFT
jgi:hypothetical protein